MRDHPRDYDAWFDLLRLEEARFRATGDAGRCRAAYARACAQTPPVAEKRYWRRYVYLWLGRAAFEEVDVGDVAAARVALRAALDAVPHAAFTFAKLWLAAADLEVRAEGRAWLDFLARNVGLPKLLLTRKLKLRGSPKLLSAFGRCFST